MCSASSQAAEMAETFTDLYARLRSSIRRRNHAHKTQPFDSPRQ